MPYADSLNGVLQPAPSSYTPSPDGTYPYNGGPREPIPLPRAEPAPPPPPASAAPVDDRAVSVTSAKAKYTYAAYGDGQAQTKSTDARTVAVKKEGKK